MVSLSIIFEDMEDGRVQIKSRSTREPPAEMSMATPAELVLLEVAGWVASNYNIKDEGIIDFGGLLKVDKPKIII